jgi:hypothetical protein
VRYGKNIEERKGKEASKGRGRKTDENKEGINNKNVDKEQQIKNSINVRL